MRVEDGAHALIAQLDHVNRVLMRITKGMNQMAKKRSINGYGKLQQELREAYTRIQELEGEKSAQAYDAQQKIWKQDCEIHNLKIRPAQIRRVVRMVEYVGDPVEIATTLAKSLPTGVSDRSKFTLTVTLVEDSTKDVIVRAEAARG